MKKRDKRVLCLVTLTVLAGAGVLWKESLDENSQYRGKEGSNTTNVVIVMTGTTEEGLTYRKDADEITITGYIGKSTSVIIPEKIDNIPVVEIADGAFKSLPIEDMAIRAKIEEIPKEAFAGCEALQRISFPETIAVIGEEAFADCSSLGVLLFSENVKEIGDRAFANSGQAEIYYAETAEVGEDAFADIGAAVSYIVKDGKVTICELETDKTEIQIPSFILGSPITTVTDYEDYTDLTILHTEYYESNKKVCTICGHSEEPEEIVVKEEETVSAPQTVIVKKPEAQEKEPENDWHPIKGHISESQGIITGVINGDAGDGYSHWKWDEIGWWLQYANGSCASGRTVVDQTGISHEVIRWELIDGAWYAFGADGYAKSGWTFDLSLSSWFYIDISVGMKTGWNLIDGTWYYFNPVSDGTQGRMYQGSETPDGYQVDDAGEWVE